MKQPISSPQHSKIELLGKQVRVIVAVIAWAIAAFLIAQVIAAITVNLLQLVAPNFAKVSQSIFVVAISSFIYVLMLAIMFFLPRVIGKRSPSRMLLGVHQDLNWKDIGLSLPALVIYYVATAVTLFAASSLLPWFDIEQVQETGLSMVGVPGSELVWIFLLLVLVGPIVEELIFRGYLYGKIRAAKVPFWLTTIIVSGLFGLAHMQWNVGLDTFVLSVVMCLARELTGTIWTGVLMHMIKNGIAYYILFISPIAPSSLGLIGL